MGVPRKLRLLQFIAPGLWMAVHDFLKHREEEEEKGRKEGRNPLEFRNPV